MKNKRPIYVLTILAVIALIVAGYYAYTALFQSRTTGALTASGTVEAAEVLIAPELSGKVSEVLVNEGDHRSRITESFELLAYFFARQRCIVLHTSQPLFRPVERLY